MKYFVRSEGRNRIELKVSEINTDTLKIVYRLQLQRVNWLQFQLFRWRFIRIAAGTAEDAHGQESAKVCDGQPIINLYVSALAKQSSVTKWEIENYITTLGYSRIEVNEPAFTAEGIQFRIDIKIVNPQIIQQHITVTPDGEIQFGKWFILYYDCPFDTFAEALEALAILGWWD